MTALDAALAYWHAGLSVLPVRADGSKAPALAAGHPLLKRERRAAEAELRQWFANGHGVAVHGGAISGGAECLDFDDPAAFGPWWDLAGAACPGLARRLCVIQTPAGGFHVWYRCPGQIRGNTKLAMSEAKAVLIETRGEGGYALAPGSPLPCHQSGKPYLHVDGPPLEQIAEVTPAEHAAMIEAARALDRCPRQAQTSSSHTGGEQGGGRPGDHFNRRGPSFPDLLTPHGWQIVRGDAERGFLRRPGKTAGISASYGLCQGRDGTPLFYPFSTNAAPFEPNTAYDKFRVYALLEHHGGLKAAAQALAAQGYASTPIPGPAAAPAALITPDTAFTAAELMQRALPPVRWAVEGLIAEGFTIFGGRPKIGKSWLTLHIALAVATATPALGSIDVLGGPVLYLGFEDTPRRMQKRLGLLIGDGRPDLTRLHIRLRWPAVAAGGVALIADWIAAHRPRLVVVDTLQKLRGHRQRNDDAYASDYAFVGQLQELAGDTHTAIIGNHHTSKAERVDPVDEISGTLGLSGAADTIIVFKRQRGDVEGTLFVTGRDIDEEREVAITADVHNRIFETHGSANDRRVSNERRDVLALLTRHPAGLRPRDVADLLGRPPGPVRALLWKMADTGDVITDSGRYRRAESVNGAH